MKNKVLAGSLAAALFAFMLYSAGLRRVENTEVKIVGSNSEQLTSKKKRKSANKQKQEPKIEATVTKVKVKQGSNRVLSSKIKQVMGEDPYQVSAFDLNSGTFASVSNTAAAHKVTTPSRLFLLAAIYYQEQHGKLTARTTIKITKKDQVKGENLLKQGYAYGITYLRQSMMRGSKTARNAIVRKIGLTKINQVAQKLGVKSTTVKNGSAVTTAADLARVLVNLYRGKVINHRYCGLLFTALKPIRKPSLVKKITSQNAALGDQNTAFAIVQGQGHSYCLAVWSSSSGHFAVLGKAVQDWITK